MKALEIESQTDQIPLTRRRCCSTQRELAKTQHLFDDPDHWFDRTFACPVDRFTQGGLELVRHLHLRTRVLGWRIRERSKALLPTGMMGITACRDVRLDAALGTCGQRRGAKIASVQRRRIGCPDGCWDG